MHKVAIFLILLLSWNMGHAMVRAGVQVGGDDDDGGNTEVQVWIGPGWYNGIWFDNEDEYWYYHNHYHGGHHHHGGGGHHHGGGGHHHGGGHH